MKRSPRGENVPDDLPPLARRIAMPENFYLGMDAASPVEVPRNLLLWTRTDRKALQRPVDITNYCHHRYELVLPLVCEGTIFSGGHFIDVRPGQAVLIHPCQTHGFPKIGAGEMLWLFCTFELSDDAAWSHLAHRAIPVPDDAWALARILIGNFSNPPEHSDSASAALFAAAALLCRLSREARRHPAQSASSIHDREDTLRIHAVCDYIDRELSGGIRIEDVARFAAISESRLRTMFRQQAGMSLGRYLRLRRIHAAASLLRNTAYRVGEIARRSGFDSVYSFSRAFAREMKASPSEYRKGPA